MENGNVMILPSEVKELAVKVSEKKQAEVVTVLNQIFTGTADWERQVDAIEVKGIGDKMSIQLADVARKNVKNARLVAEKIFDAKRDEVQNAKAEYDLEDKLWLKAKQVMQLKFKAIEEKAEWKARTVERYEAEQKELRTQVCIEKLSKYNSEINRIEFENMSDEMFNMFLGGFEKAYNDRIAAEKKAEDERIAKEKADAEEREIIRLENIRLKAEAEEAERQLREERIRAEAERREMEEKDRKERENSERIWLAERKASDEKLRIEREAKAKLEAEMKAKEEAEEKLKREEYAKLEAELKAKQLAEKKANAAPDKVKLEKFADAIDSLMCDELKTEEAYQIEKNAKDLLTKVSLYIREKTKLL